MTAATMTAVDPPLPEVAGVEHHFVDVDGVRTHYAEAGTGDPLILLHGWPQHWYAWRELIGPLAEHYRVICPDTRGMGWTDSPASGYTAWDLERELFALMDVLGFERVRLIGTDWGNITGYLASFDAPERIERFVPMGGVHPWSAAGSSPRVYVQPWHIYLLATRAGRALIERTGFARFLIGYWRGPASYPAGKADEFVRMARRPRSAAAAAQRYRSIVVNEIPWFLRHYRGLRLHVPTLHLDGRHDPITRGMPDSWRRFADDMRLEIVPEAGHFIAEQNPGWVLDRVLPFLE